MNDRTDAFRRFVQDRMAAEGIGSYVELADVSDVGRDTLQRWLRHENAPQPRAGGRVARALGVNYRDLIDAWEGRQKDAPPEGEASLVEAIRAQTDAINELVDVLRPVAGPLGQQVADLQWAVQRLYEQVGLGSPRPPVRRATEE